MEKELMIINQQEVLGKNFTVYGDFENPLFLAKDVAVWIEYNPNDINKLVALVDEDEKLTRTIFWSGQNREMWFLTEDGLYEVLMQSRKPIAKAFKKEVKKILKAIRQNGFYANPEMIHNPDFLIHLGKLGEQIKQEQAEKMHLQEEVFLLTEVLTEIEPKLNYVDKILSSDSTMTTTQIAADYGISARKLNDILHQERVQWKVGQQWILYKEYMNQNLTSSETLVVNEGKKIVVHTKWTQEGRLLIHNILITRGFEPL